MEQTRQIVKIRNYYVEKEQSEFDKLKDLNRKVKNPANVFAYTFGTIGSLVMGSGMSLAMKVIGASNPILMPIGIGVGVVGIIMVSANYFLYKKIIERRKKKYAKEIVELSDQLLNV